MRFLESLACPACGAHLAVEKNVVHAAPGFRPPGFPAARLEHLRRLEEKHFWFRPRRRLIARVLGRLPLEGTDTAAELGCGHGGLLEMLAAVCDRVIGVEAYPAAAEAAAAACPHAVVIQGDLARLPLAAGQVRLVLAADVLEHMPPEAMLGEAHRLTSSGGWLVLTVPALPWLWSWADEAAEHRCRYTVRRLREELAENGWLLVGWTHYQLLLLPLVLLSRKILGHRLGSVERRPARAFGALLGVVNRLEVVLLGGLRLPCGSSLVAWARRQP